MAVAASCWLWLTGDLRCWQPLVVLSNFSFRSLTILPSTLIGSLASWFCHHGQPTLRMCRSACANSLASTPFWPIQIILVQKNLSSVRLRTGGWLPSQSGWLLVMWLKMWPCWLLKEPFASRVSTGLLAHFWWFWPPMSFPHWWRLGQLSLSSYAHTVVSKHLKTYLLSRRCPKPWWSVGLKNCVHLGNWIIVTMFLFNPPCWQLGLCPLSLSPSKTLTCQVWFSQIEVQSKWCQSSLKIIWSV